jgi:putative DNA primase/helicase
MPANHHAQHPLIKSHATRIATRLRRLSSDPNVMMNHGQFGEDLNELRGILKGCAADLATALLGFPNRMMSSKRQLRFGNKGSLAVIITGPKTGWWYDHEYGEGGDLFNLIQRENNCNFRAALEYAQAFIGGAVISPSKPGRPQHQHNDEERDSSTSRFAERIWNGSVDPRGTVVEAYIKSRGLELPDGVADNVIRFHRPFIYKGRKSAGMVTLFRGIKSNDPVAISLTFLDDDAVKLERRFFGPVAGAAIKFDGNIKKTLHVGEGIESCLAGMLAGFTPAWALGSAGGIASFPVIDGIRTLRIFGEVNDGGANERAAESCALR